jgi:hypothetical protein
VRLAALQQRIRDRLSPEWLTPSEQIVWEQLHRFSGPPHRIVSVYGPRGSGKSFLGWLMQREQYGTYGIWPDEPKPVHPRLVLDNAPTAQASTRALRPLIEKLGIQQIILLSRERVNEPAMPAFELKVTKDDLEHFSANLYRYLNITIPSQHDYRNYRDVLESYLSREQHHGNR